MNDFKDFVALALGFGCGLLFWLAVVFSIVRRGR